MISGRRSDNGALFITETVPLDYQLVGGIAISNAGSMWVTSTLPPQVFANGFGLRHTGQLCINYGGPIDHFSMGLPFTSDGRLVCQLNVAPWSGDSYVGGIRVGPLGGVYVIDLTPPPDPYGFDAGFSTGFDVAAI